MGAGRGAGLAPSLTLFRIFRNTNYHGYQSLGSSLATFALRVRLTKLFLHSADGCCGRTRACRQRRLLLPPQPAAGTQRHRGKAATRPGAQAAFRSLFCCTSPNYPPIIPLSRSCLAPPYQAARTSQLSFSLTHDASSSVFERLKRIRCSYHRLAMATQHQCWGQRAFLTPSLSEEELFKASHRTISPAHRGTSSAPYSACWCRL